MGALTVLLSRAMFCEKVALCREHITSPGTACYFVNSKAYSMTAMIKRCGHIGCMGTAFAKDGQWAIQFAQRRIRSGTSRCIFTYIITTEYW